MKWGRFIRFAAMVALGFGCYLLGRYGADDSVHHPYQTKLERFHPIVKNEGVDRSTPEEGKLRDVAVAENFSGDAEFADLFSRLDLLEDLPGKDYMLYQLLSGWGELDGSAAMNFALSLPLNKQANAIRSVLKGWAKKNSEAAWQWVSDQPVSKHIPKTGMFRAVVREMINQGNFDRGIQLISSISEEGTPKTKERLSYQLMKNWLAKDSGAALQWIDQMPEGPSSEGTLKAFAGDWARTDGLEAAEWALSMEDQSGTLTSAIAAWTMNGEPVEVAQWLKGQSPSVEMDNAISIFARASARENPELAQSMLNSIQDQDTRDRTVLLLSNRQAGPAESLQWLDTHLSGNRSEAVQMTTGHMIERLVREWAGSDLNAATAYVYNSTLLTEEERSRVLRSLSTY